MLRINQSGQADVFAQRKTFCPYAAGFIAERAILYALYPRMFLQALPQGHKDN